jgi:hypothetical protein
LTFWLAMRGAISKAPISTENNRVDRMVTSATADWHEIVLLLR